MTSSNQDPLDYLEVQQAEEVHPNEGVPSAPHIHQHNGEGLAEEEEVDRQCAEHHTPRAEHEHNDKVSGPAAEGAILEVPAVAVGEDQVEEECEAHRPEEQERRDQSPKLWKETGADVRQCVNWRHFLYEKTSLRIFVYTIPLSLISHRSYRC